MRTRVRAGAPDGASNGSCGDGSHVSYRVPRGDRDPSVDRRRYGRTVGRALAASWPALRIFVWSRLAVWALAAGLRGQPEPPGIWVAGVAAAFTATLVATVAFAAREGD